MKEFTRNVTLNPRGRDICIVCSDAESARRLNNNLFRDGLRKFRDKISNYDCGSFILDKSDISSPLGGSIKLYVADVFYVKGLEFENVIVWEPNGTNFGGTFIPEENDQLRLNRLYVSVTRAMKKLAIVSNENIGELHPVLETASNDILETREYFEKDEDFSKPLKVI